MKTYRKYIYRYVLTLGTMLLLTACADTYWNDIEEKPINLMASRAFNATRAATDIQGAVFDANEDVNVFITVSSNGTLVSANDAGTPAGDPIVFKTSAADASGKNKLTPKNTNETPYYPLGDGALANAIYAAYPTSVGKDDETFTVQYDQTSDRNYKNSDLMLATPILNHAKNNEVIPLPFEHKMAKLIISAIGDPGITMDGTLILGSTEHDGNGSGVYRTVGISVPDGDFATSGAPATPILSDKGSIVMSNGGAVLIPPQEVTTADFIVVTGHTSTDPTPRECRFALAQKKFEAGKVYKLNLAIGMDNFTDAVQITGWTDDYGELTVTPSGGYQGVSIEDMDPVTYNTKEHKPKPKVYYGTIEKIRLTEGQDFIYSYVDNVNAGNAQVLVIGQNYYAGLAAVNGFTINKALASINFPENSDKTDVPFEIDGELAAVKANNTGDGIVTYSAADEASAQKVGVDPVDGTLTIQNIGTATIKATAADGQNYYYTSDTKSDTYSVTIIAKPASETTLNVIIDTGNTIVSANAGGKPAKDYFVYNGEEQVLSSLIVTDGENTLAQGLDYDFELTNSKDVGYATLKITGKKNYNAEFTVDIPVYVATPTITVDETTLTMGIHKNTAPKTRRKSRVATTQEWAKNYLRYTPADEDIVTINEHGLITGLKAGTTTIYVDVDADDSGKGNWDAAVQKSFQVTVVNSDFTFELERNSSGVLSKYDNGIPVGGLTEWECPASGYWQLDCYGAQGAGTPASWRNAANTATVTPVNRGLGGRGAHIAGRVYLKKGQILYVIVGEQGRNILPGESRTETQLPKSSTWPNNQYFELCGYAWNGGGNSLWGGIEHSSYRYNVLDKVNFPISGGGGATDISLKMGTYTGSPYMKGYKKDGTYAAHVSGTAIDSMCWKSAEHLYSRIIVAGGGGGAIYYDSASDGKGFGDGGDGGAYVGGDGLFNDHGNGGTLSSGGMGGIKYHKESDGTLYNGRDQRYIYLDGPQDGGMSGMDGMFGEGGYFTCICEGNGCGGGGWYGGGSAGQAGPNGSGGGGSSYLWCNDLASYYPNSTHKPSTEFYLTEVIADKGARAGDGKAMITAVELDDVCVTKE